jgi:4-hydroxyphenylpyruvate dioxygenase
MNLVVNASPDDARVSATTDGQPVISAVAFRVRDALQAHTRCMELGAWNVSSQAQAMELHIPAIHGPGGSRFYFVDRWQEFSIYDIDFKPIPTVDQHPEATAGMGYFGVVQYIGAGRSADWLAYFEHMFDFSFVPDDQRFGILPKGKLMKSPCGNFLWQLIEPDHGWMLTSRLSVCSASVWARWMWERQWPHSKRKVWSLWSQPSFTPKTVVRSHAVLWARCRLSWFTKKSHKVTP